MPSPNKPLTRLGHAIRSMRKDAGYTQQTFAMRMGVSQATVSGWEVGAVRPDPSMMMALRDVIDLPLESFWWDVDGPQTVSAEAAEGGQETARTGSMTDADATSGLLIAS